jgi:hypothetical protein
MAGQPRQDLGKLEGIEVSLVHHSLKTKMSGNPLGIHGLRVARAIGRNW